MPKNTHVITIVRKFPTWRMRDTRHRKRLTVRAEAGSLKDFQVSVYGMGISTYFLVKKRPALKYREIRKGFERLTRSQLSLKIELKPDFRKQRQAFGIRKRVYMRGFADIDINIVREKRESMQNWTDDLWTDYFYLHQKDIPLLSGKRVKDPLKNDSDMNDLARLLTHLQDTQQKLEAFQADDTAVVFGYNNLRFVLPASLVKVEEMKEYSRISPNMISSITHMGSSGNESGLVQNVDYTTESISRKKSSLEKDMQGLEESVRKIESEEAEELADIKRQMDALKEQMEKKKKSLMEVLSARKAEMEAKMAEYKQQLYMLETQIYGMRCYLGEVVSFHTVRDGIPAPAEEPVVIYQKIRFLDEELGRYLSLYGDNIGDHITGTLLQVLKHRDDIADLLAPGPKSISAVRISRTGTFKDSSGSVTNMLQDYQIYHDNQLAVLIRNGGQLHIAWLDAEKICVSDDNMFFNPSSKAEVSVNEDTVNNDIYGSGRKARKREAEINCNDMLSRWFYFNVLQGVLDNTTLISLPEKVSLMKGETPYVIFSMADSWLKDSGYGSFEQIIKKSAGIPLVKGDMVLTGMHITRDDTYSQRNETWNNNRGIGDKNRTYGVSLPRQKIIPVNKVIPCIRVRYKVQVVKGHIEKNPEGMAMYQYTHEDGSVYQTNRPGKDGVLAGYEATYKAVMEQDIVREYETTELIEGDRWYGCCSITSTRKATSAKQLSLYDLKRMSHIYEDSPVYFQNTDHGEQDGKRTVTNLGDAYEKKLDIFFEQILEAEIIEETDHQYYASVKQHGWNGEYYVNFRFYPDEVIPLTFLCTDWVRSVITTGDIGSFRLCGADMNFSDMLPYLHIMLKHLEEREAEEKEMISRTEEGSRFIKENPGWSAALCEWKIANHIHSLTPTRAKKFIQATKTAKY